MKNATLILFVFVLLFIFTADHAGGGILDDVKAKGSISIGINPTLPGISFVDTKGNYSGFAVDFAKALAAAVGVDANFKPLPSAQRFAALQSGEIHAHFATNTWTMSRDMKVGVEFPAVFWYDGQGFLLRKSLGVKNAKELSGASVCLTSGTTSERNTADYFRAHNMTFKPVLFSKHDDSYRAYDEGRCDVMIGDKGQLAGRRSALKNPKEHVILDELISKEPLGPMTPGGDDQWAGIVRWVINAVITAEEKEITQANVEEVARTSKDPEVQRLLGVTGSLGPDTGLDKDWALRAIKAAGNYGEIWNRNLGKNSPLALDRGLNVLWSKGGLLYAPPFK
jgi:general L-amino acid transport system substrate-binding protein